ncbi:hypothetical protein A3L02_01005 [Thermococcus celer Vu 13 = JCM 8558]|uniref:Uncharacterized protein n=2 Tax=Thermococcus celer TaxID=2264 RepID=A0A218NZY0_THECE|nr:hypothetical protein [Thermococcus celer]ASI98244.1 hypothetical protein A3L02_01005 [Thermococcus celer Vu 13 = JCM 8558]
MDDILIPRERTDAVVLIGVDGAERVEFIKVYAVDEGTAKRALEEFFNARGLFPADYRLVSRGSEDVGDRRAITTKSEVELSSSLARLGLKLLSNGILHLDGLESLYQFTLVSESLYRRIVQETRRGEEEPERAEKTEKTLEFEPLDVLSLGVDVLVENLRGVDLEKLLPPKARLLREPELRELIELMGEERDFPIVVETRNAARYSVLDFPATVRLPPLTVEEFAAELSGRLGFRVDPKYFKEYPPEKLNLRNVKALAKLVRALIEKKGFSGEGALSIAVRLNLGGL